MTCFSDYDSPIGRVLLREEDGALTGLWLEGQKYCPVEFPGDAHWGDTPLLERAKDWLDQYFAGRRPSVSELPLNPRGTDFRCRVWRQLSRIPYGQTVTYGELARALGMGSPRAVGNAVGRNPISIIIPCHRVLGSGGSLTGYAGGVERKKWLLDHERDTGPVKESRGRGDFLPEQNASPKTAESGI